MGKKLAIVAFAVIGLASISQAGTDVVRDFSAQFPAPPPPPVVYYAPPPVRVVVYPAPVVRVVAFHRFCGPRVICRSHWR